MAESTSLRLGLVLIGIVAYLVFLPFTQASPITTLAQTDGLPSPVSQEEVASFMAPATFAADAYCTGLHRGSTVGQDGQVLWQAGDGDHLQMVYVAYSPSIGIVVAHQGTNQSSSASLQNDLRINAVQYDGRLAQSFPATARVADGFQKAWLDTAEMVVEQVKLALKQYPHANVTVTGHSLGAAISLLDAMYIRQSVNATVRAVLFGMPRVGNQEFADAVDQRLSYQHHIIHASDPIPHMPFRSMGFRHPSGQVWIPSYNSTDSVGVSFDTRTPVQCPGQESPWCADSVDFRDYQLGQHNGPYFGVEMGCQQT